MINEKEYLLEAMNDFYECCYHELDGDNVKIIDTEDMKVVEVLSWDAFLHESIDAIKCFIDDIRKDKGESDILYIISCLDLAMFELAQNKSADTYSYSSYWNIKQDLKNGRKIF